MKDDGSFSATVLVVDDDASFREVIVNTLSPRGLKMIGAGGGHEALSILSMETVDLVLTDIKMPEMHGIELLHALRAKHPLIPVVLMTGFNDLIEMTEAIEIGAKGFLNKPFSTSDLINSLESNLQEKFPDICLDEVSEKPKKTMMNPSDFCHILIDEFTYGSQIQFPVFIKLSEDKMVKLANHGEDLPSKTIERLKQKGVKYLYLENEDFKKYLHFNTKILNAMSKSNKIDPVRKSKFISQTLKNMMKFGVEKDFNPELAEMAKNNLNIVVDMYASQGKSLSVLEQLMSNADLYEHSVHVSLVATMIARSLGWSSTQKLFLVTAAGLFHDVGKQQLDPMLLEKNFDDLNEEERTEFESHSQIGASIIKDMGNFPEGLEQIVLHHHERVDGSGFPHGYGRVKIHPVAKIIALADDFCHQWADALSQKNKPNPRRILTRLEENRVFYEGEHLRALTAGINEELSPKKGGLVRKIA